MIDTLKLLRDIATATAVGALVLLMSPIIIVACALASTPARHTLTNRYQR